jgi:hypothetical protein
MQGAGEDWCDWFIGAWVVDECVEGHDAMELEV